MQWDSTGKNENDGYEELGKTTATVFTNDKVSPPVIQALTLTEYVDKTERTPGSYFYRVAAANAAGSSATWSTGEKFYYAGKPGTAGTPSLKGTASKD